jgi:hypothetical protein
MALGRNLCGMNNEIGVGSARIDDRLNDTACNSVSTHYRCVARHGQPKQAKQRNTPTREHEFFFFTL